MEQVLSILEMPEGPDKPVLTAEMLKAQGIPEEVVAQIMASYNLGKEKLGELISLKKTLGKEPPADASDDEKRLYQLPLSLLALSKDSAQLTAKVEEFKKVLPLMPNAVHLTE